MSQISAIDVVDLRFPTSASLDGSDAMNPDPDYSAAYLIVSTDADDSGHGFVFTIGRGNDIQTEAVRVIAETLIGREVEPILTDMGAFWRELVHDSQLRWLGPEKGVSHMAIGAIVNALWDLKAKRAGLPLWELLAGMSPEEILDLLDFRYLSDFMTRDDARAILAAAEPGKAERIAELRDTGYMAYTTTPGWLGYSDEKLARLCREAIDEGFTQIKLKVGADRDDDIRRLGIAREICGPGFPIAIDANQHWDTAEAIDWIGDLARFDLRWVEEPTSPDDILAHAAIQQGIAPVPVATGEHCQNRIVFKQMLEADALRVMQIDATRVAGVNENITNLLLAAHAGVPVCPHAGGVGLCELVQHLSLFDFVAVSATMDDRCIEFVDHLHEHFVTPVDVHDGRYWPPSAPGAGAEILSQTLSDFAYPTGPQWRARAASATTSATPVPESA
ncbi:MULTISPECIES: enolase C-terminal domain-like protein [unclassified Brevibacterium]|uniref:enolase C-terminal domain-like protein n=1 Tax=unclassified Brevibacterium TaxID=2614124 RepID=UPI0010F6103A|nr:MULTISPECIES: enolase C-terminal domain-like protein [unclassified Brevibacterium]MCM1014011.1 fuconate dehydratase [Brevibacterium sp. XM4083]